MSSTELAKTVSLPPFGNVCFPASESVTESLVTFVTVNAIGLYSGTFVLTFLLATFVTVVFIFCRASTL